MAGLSVAKRKIKSRPRSYFAVKSHNEIYYQMASIFKYASNEKPWLADEILLQTVQFQPSEIFLENSV